MADYEQAPNVDNTNTGDLDLEALLESILGTTNASTQASVQAAQVGVEGMLEQQKRQHEFLQEGYQEAEKRYTPFVDGGLWWLKQFQDMYKQGAPKYSWDKEFKYDEWNWDKEFEHESMGDFMKRRLGKENMASSPYYGLYQFQKEQQDADIQKSMRARGLYNSGAGMKNALRASTGMDQQFAADEYKRGSTEYGVDYDQALTKYMMDYEQQLQSHSIGYEEARQKYGMDYDQYLKKFGADYGAYQDRMTQAANMGNYAWLGTQAISNAKLGVSTTAANNAIQTGQTIAALQSNLGNNITSTYNAQANNATNLYNATQNRLLTSTLANQYQQNYNNANNANQNLAWASLATNLGRSAFDAYRYYNQPAAQTYTLPADYNFVSYA